MRGPRPHAADASPSAAEAGPPERQGPNRRRFKTAGKTCLGEGTCRRAAGDRTHFGTRPRGARQRPWTPIPGSKKDPDRRPGLRGWKRRAPGRRFDDRHALPAAARPTFPGRGLERQTRRPHWTRAPCGRPPGAERPKAFRHAAPPGGTRPSPSQSQFPQGERRRAAAAREGSCRVRQPSWFANGTERSTVHDVARPKSATQTTSFSGRIRPERLLQGKKCREAL